MKKKILTLILATSMVAVMLVGCGDKSSEATTATTQSAVGSDGRDYGDNGGTSTVAGEAPAGDVSTESDSENVPLNEQMSLDEYLNSRNLVDLPQYGIEFKADILQSYSEVDTDEERENFYRTQIARETIGGYESGIYTVYNPLNYSNTLEMINVMCDEFTESIYVLSGTTDLMPEETDVFQRSDDNGNGSVSNEQIANAIDSFSNELGSKAVLVTILPYDKVTFYFDNGLVYSIEGTAAIGSDELYFNKSYCNGYETDDAPYVYRCDYEGNVEITSAK